MKVIRTVRFNIKETHVDYGYIKTQLIESKEVYNFANYVLRQLYFKNSKEHKYSLDFIDEYLNLKDLFLEYINENKQFTTLFYKLICEFAKLKDYNLVEYNNQVMSKTKLKLGYVGTAKMVQGVKIVNIHKDLKCKCFRVYYKNGKIICELIYEKIINNVERSGKVASIDLGLENLFTVAFNYNKKPIAIKGNKLKAVNQYFNKEKAKMQSSLPSKQFVSKNIQRLLYKREEQLRNYIGYYTNKLVDILEEDKVSKVVVGYNKGWKQGINIGSVNNQNFVSIPFKKILGILKYKLQDKGIEYVEQEESYTSKASYLDNDYIPTYGDGKIHVFSGFRIKRSLYKTKQGKIIDADLNAALNILRKSGEKLIERLDYLQFNNIFTSKLV